jgi:hypothetical protein
MLNVKHCLCEYPPFFRMYVLESNIKTIDRIHGQGGPGRPGWGISGIF